MYTQFPFRLYWQQITPWWKSDEKKLAWGGLCALIAMSFVSIYIAVLSNAWMKVFYNALEDRDFDAFIHQALIYIPLMAVILLDFCGRNYLTAWLSFRWRRWMTASLQTEWLTNKNYYKIAQDGKITDNPDQRIAMDLQEIATFSIALFSTFFREGVNVITFSILLWGLSKTIALAFFGVAITIPGFLVWAAFIYSLFGILITFKVGRPLIDLARNQERFEADFRYRLIRTFEYREEIAFLAGEPAESLRLQDAFQAIKTNYYRIMRYQVYINLFQNFYFNGNLFIPLFLVGPAYFSGAITLGLLMQVRSMFSEVSGSLLSIMVEFQRIASLMAAFQRVVGFRSHMQNLSLHPLPTVATSHITIRDVELCTSDQQVFWKVPLLTLNPGERKTLMAQSGIGKTSLLRILAGLKDNYRSNGATIALPNPLFFIPQRPYMPLGTLRQCLCYPALACDDAILIALMRRCKIAHLIPRLDEAEDYQHTLSLGEQQRINFVRIFLHHPKWLLIDEPTAHLNKDYALLLSELLAEKLPDTGILAISHIPLPQFETITCDQER